MWLAAGVTNEVTLVYVEFIKNAFVFSHMCASLWWKFCVGESPLTGLVVCFVQFLRSEFGYSLLHFLVILVLVSVLPAFEFPARILDCRIVYAHKSYLHRGCKAFLLTSFVSRHPLWGEFLDHSLPKSERFVYAACLYHCWLWMTFA